MKNKILPVLCLAFTVCTLSGCSLKDSFEEKVNSDIEQKSGISMDKTYREYRTNVLKGNVKNNFYHNAETPVIPDNETDLIISENQARISFVQNSLLNVRYFSDENEENEITNPYNDFIYLNPGDNIYATVNTYNSLPGMFSFLGFRIYEHSEKGKTLVSEYSSGETGPIFTVPENCSGLDYSIEPAGRYEKIKIKLNDYYIDEALNQHTLNGTWKINDQKCENDIAEISSLDSYIVSYEYDPNLFFFISCEPRYFYQDESKILFSQDSSPAAETEYSVELYPYITATFDSESNTKVEVNGIPYGEYKKGQTIDVKKLKFGDTIVITSSKKDTIKYDKNLLLLKEVDDTFGKYTFKVREQSGDFTFDPADYSFEHGTVEFRYLGNKITGKINLAAGRQIEYSALKADEGYWLPEGDNVITVSDDAEETRKEIENIRFYEKKLITVSFPQPAEGGTVIYKKDDRTILSQSEKLFSGTTIKMTYKPWPGWKQKYTESSYTVSDEQETQTVNVNGYDVNSVFEETDDHKPNLKITANRNVGTEMKLSLHSSDTDISGLSWDRKKNCLYEGKTGTSEGITLSFSNASLPADQMIKLVIEKTDKNKKKYKDIRYVAAIPESEKIDIYADTEIKTSEIYYTDISINISLAEKMIYIAETPENSLVQLKFTDTDSKKMIQKNEYIDPDRVVELTLKPEKGYYLTGSGIINNVYQKTMKYSDYLLNFEKTDNSHPRKKICTLTLNTEDKFGKVTYTLNGISVSGVTEVREDDELIITYQLEDRNYIIYKDFLSAMHDLLTKSPYERSEKIKISPEIDGTTISREDYITIQKKEKQP